MVPEVEPREAPVRKPSGVASVGHDGEPVAGPDSVDSAEDIETNDAAVGAVEAVEATSAVEDGESAETDSLDEFIPVVTSLARRAADPTLESVLLDVLEAELGDEVPGVNTFDRLRERLVDLFGPDGKLEAMFLASSLGLREEDDEELQRLFERVDADVREAVLALIRRLRARYGPQMKRAFTIAGRPPRDWSNLNAAVRQALTGQSWEIELSIRRYDSEEFVLTCSPESMISLLQYGLQQVNSLPPNDAAGELISSATLSEFVTEADFFLQRYAQADNAAAAVEPTADIEAGASEGTVVDSEVTP